VARLILNADRSVVFHGPAGVTENLGVAGPDAKDIDVLGWMTGLVSPFDTITTPEGTFVVSAPANNPPRRFISQPAAMEYRS
jgi:hypothetical protein